MNFQFLLPIILLLFSAIKRNKDFIFLSLLLFLSLISGLRVDTGTDFKIYLDTFQGKFPISGMDPGFIFYSLLLFQTDPSGRLGIFLTAFLTIFFHLLFIRKLSPNLFISYLLFICLPIFFLSTLNLIRSHLSIGFGLLSIIFLLNNRILLSILAILFASIFHFGGLIFLIIFFYPLVNKKIIFLMILSILLIFISLMATNVESLISFYIPALSYFSSHEVVNSPLLAGIILLLNLITLYLYYRDPQLDSKKKILILLNVVSIAAYSFWFVSDYSNLWLRISNFSAIHLLITIPLMLEKIEPVHYRVNISKIMSVFLVILYLSYWIIDPSYGYKE